MEKSLENVIELINTYIQKGTIVKANRFGVIVIDGCSFEEQKDGQPDNYDNDVKFFIFYKSESLPIKILVAYPINK